MFLDENPIHRRELTIAHIRQPPAIHEDAISPRVLHNNRVVPDRPQVRLDAHYRLGFCVEYDGGQAIRRWPVIPSDQNQCAA